MNCHDCGEQEEHVVRKGHSTGEIAKLLGDDVKTANLVICAEFSADCKHRYVWRLRWSERPPLFVVGLIPSYADERQDDATVRKCIEIAVQNGYGELVMLNMFSAWPTSDHRAAALRGRLYSVRPTNDRHIGDLVADAQERCGTIVAAWGNDGWSRHALVLALLGENVQCFGTKDLDGHIGAGFPRHASLRGIEANSVVIQPY